MSRVFFTADHHFGHQGIIGHCDRPFTTAQEMNEFMVANWNAVVRPEDEVWHLGDFAHRVDPKHLPTLFSRLHGRKHLVLGNHDGPETQNLPWASQQQMAFISRESTRLVLCHYGMRVWPGQHRGAIHLFGHSHGRLPGTSLSHDVGVDSWAFMPVTLKQIRDRLKELPDVDSEADFAMTEAA